MLDNIREGANGQTSGWTPMMSSSCLSPVASDHLDVRRASDSLLSAPPQPLSFFDDFSFLLLTFLDEQPRQQQPPQGQSQVSRTTEETPPSCASFGPGCDSISVTDVSTSTGQAPSALGELRTLLQQAQRVVQPTHRAGYADALSQAPLFLIRFRQLLEEQVHHRQARQLGIVPAVERVPVAAAPMSVTPLALSSLRVRHFEEELHSLTGEVATEESAASATAQLHRNGRRFSVAVAHRPEVPSPRSLANATTQLEGVEPASAASGLLLQHGEACSATGAHIHITRVHGELLLHLQQHLVRTLAGLEAIVTAEAEQHGAWRGIVTDGLADRLQSAFLGELGAILETVGRADGACSENEESRIERPEEEGARGDADSVRQEVTDVSARMRRSLGSAHGAHQRTGTPNRSGAGVSSSVTRLVVHEVGEGVDGTREGSILFGPTSPRFPLPSACSMAREEPPFMTPGSASVPHLEGEVPAGFGVSGSGFPAKLVAQHIWCYQCVLRQRFPSFTGTWTQLERTLYFVESLRSPTPTAPRSQTSSPSASIREHASEVGCHEEVARGEGGTGSGSNIDLLPQRPQDGAVFAVNGATSRPVSLSPRARRDTTPSVGHSLRSMEDGSASGSASSTPTRPPPAVECTQEKGTRPPQLSLSMGLGEPAGEVLFPAATAAADAPPLARAQGSLTPTTSLSSSLMLSPSLSTTYFQDTCCHPITAASMVCGEIMDTASSCRRRTSRTRRISGTAQEVQALMDRLEPCTLFATFLEHMKGKHTPTTRGLGLHARSNSSSMGSAATKASTRTAAHSPSRSMPRGTDAVCASLECGSAAATCASRELSKASAVVNNALVVPVSTTHRLPLAFHAGKKDSEKGTEKRYLAQMGGAA